MRPPLSIRMIKASPALTLTLISCVHCLEHPSEVRAERVCDPNVSPKWATSAPKKSAAGFSSIEIRIAQSFPNKVAAKMARWVSDVFVKPKSRSWGTVVISSGTGAVLQPAIRASVKSVAQPGSTKKRPRAIGPKPPWRPRYHCRHPCYWRWVGGHRRRGQPAQAGSGSTDHVDRAQ